MKKFTALFIPILTILFVFLSAAAIVYAYSTQEILNWCYPNSLFNGNKMSCNASSIQPGASCTENVGGSPRGANECGCFGQNPNHTYVITHYPTQCNDGQGNISQFETFECNQDLGVQWGQCGNPSTCNFAQDCEAPPGDGPHSGTQVLTGLLQNGSCGPSALVPANPSVCKPKESTQVIPVDANAEFDPQIISQGEPVNVYISATRPCANASNPKFDQGKSLLGDGPNGQCVLVQPMTCDKPNPSGDWRKCWAEYQCKAADKVGLYTASFTNDNPSCTNIDSYNIRPPKDCATKARTQAPITTGDITDQTLQDDRYNANLMQNGSQPDDLVKKMVDTANQKDAVAFVGNKATDTTDSKVKTGVQEGFFGGLQSFACGIGQNALVQFLLKGVGLLTYCPQRVNLASKDTYLIHGQSTELAQAEIPPGAEPDPAHADCVLQDVPEKNGDPVLTEGNKKLNETDSSFKVKYIGDIPQFTPKPIDTTQGLMLDGKHLDDKRPGDIDQNCQLYQQSNFPDLSGPSTGTNTPTGVSTNFICNNPSPSPSPAP